MKRFVIGCAVLVVGALLMPGVASVTLAQDESSWMRVDIMQVLPRELDEFIEMQLEQVNPALERAGVPWRSAWRTAEFGNTYERLFVTPMDSLAELDFGGPLARVLEPEQLRRIADRVRRTLSSRQSYAVRYRPDLSVESDNVSGLSLAWTTTIQVAPGRTADWEAFLRREHSAVPGRRCRLRRLRACVRAGTGDLADRREPRQLLRARSTHHPAAHLRRAGG